MRWLKRFTGYLQIRYRVILYPERNPNRSEQLFPAEDKKRKLSQKLFVQFSTSLNRKPVHLRCRSLNRLLRQLLSEFYSFTSAKSLLFSSDSISKTCNISGYSVNAFSCRSRNVSWIRISFGSAENQSSTSVCTRSVSSVHWSPGT